jgi:Spy/CpxP family protein refolding chaperone
MIDPFTADATYIEGLSDDELVDGLAEADARRSEANRTRHEAEVLVGRWLGVKTMIQHEQWKRLTPEQREDRSQELKQWMREHLGWSDDSTDG